MKKLPFRQTLVAGLTVAALGLSFAGAGLASAATNSASGGQSDLIAKIASTFNLDKDKVAEVFAADRQEHEAKMQTEQASRLAQAVKDGKLTQAQADHITAAQKEIQSLRGTGGPGQETDSTRTAVKAKLDALRTWATEQNVDAQYLGGPGGHGGPGGPDGSRGGMPPAGASTDSAQNSIN